MNKNYSPKGKLLWDSWLIKDNNKFHIFYLQATPSKDPEERHNSHVTIGHAVSEDLIHWKELPIALEPGENDSWDDLALWTGSVIKKDEKYFMFYTGRNKNEDKKWIQKIGLAVSNDLTKWGKIKNNPILEAEKYYYIDNQKNKLEKIGAWRDPFIFQDPESQKYYMTISAREKNNKREYDGCVAIAESSNLLNWKILPPIFSPNVYDEIETTQVIFHKGFYYLFFSTHASNYEPNFAKKNGAFGGLHCYYSKNLFEGYKPVNDNGVVLGNGDEMYDIRLLHDKKDKFFAIGWFNKSKKKKFTGKLTLPFKIKIEKNKVFRIE
ncbi:MAG: glycoside hydrolase family 68 protein [Bacteroidales bacterium]|nr:glycoside hydrolase family 68 protein [Bacteroidales bacterium]